MKILITLLALVTSTAFAGIDSNPCENFAKAAAIRVYKAETGVIQGSSGVEYSARLLFSKNKVHGYKVSIHDGNEDGETWTVDYSVKMLALDFGCKTLEVKRL